MAKNESKGGGCVTLIAGLLIIGVVISLIGGGGEDEPSESAASKPAASRDGGGGLKSRIEGSSWTIQGPEVRSIDRGYDSVQVILNTPSGGMEGPSTRDLNEQAAATFAEIYRGGGPQRATVKFAGGLIDTTNGKELPSKLTGQYEVSRSEAKQIDWSDEDTVRYAIDWSYYRTFVHPAIKMDD